MKAHQYEMAVEAFSKVIESNPNSAEAYNNLGIAWCKQATTARTRLIITQPWK